MDDVQTVVLPNLINEDEEDPCIISIETPNFASNPLDRTNNYCPAKAFRALILRHPDRPGTSLLRNIKTGLPISQENFARQFREFRQYLIPLIHPNNLKKQKAARISPYVFRVSMLNFIVNEMQLGAWDLQQVSRHKHFATAEKYYLKRTRTVQKVQTATGLQDGFSRI